MNEPMGCKFFQEHLNAYLDSELDQETRARMTRHAGLCPECSERLETATRLLTMCAELDEGLAIPLDVQAAWRKAVRAEAAKPKASKGRGFIRALGTIAAAAVLVAGGTFAYRIQQNAPVSPTISPVTYQSSASSASADAGNYYFQEDSSPLTGGVNARSLAADGNEATVADSDALASADEGESAAKERRQVVLKNAWRELTTTTFESCVQEVENLVDEYAGHTERATVSGQSLDAPQGEGRSALFAVRVPTEDLNDFLTALDAVSTVTYKSESSEDISTRYYDAQARLDSLKTQRDRLNELVTTAASLEDLLMLQDKLSETQLTIDSLEGQIRGWNNHAQYSTVEITVTEVPVRDQVKPIGDTLQERIRTAFYDSINWLNGFLQDAAVVLAMAAPALVIVVPVVIVVWIVVAAIRRRRRRNR